MATERVREFGEGEARALARLLKEVTGLGCQAVMETGQKTQKGKQSWQIVATISGAGLLYTFTNYRDLAAFVRTRVSGYPEEH